KTQSNDGNEITTSQVTDDEVEESRMGQRELLFSMLSICGPWAVLTALSFTLRVAVVGIYLVWIKNWTTESSRSETKPEWVIGLTVLCISDVVFGCLGAVLLAVACRNLSSRLHKAMIRSVLRSPMHFFDATPRGRVMNRFSADVDNIETRFYLATKQVLETIALGVARIVVTGLQAPAAGLVGGSVTATFLFLVAVVAKASNAARRLESVECSRLLQHVAETRELLGVVRSYGVADHFCGHCYRLVDVALRPLVALFDCFRSVRFLGGLCGFLVILASVVFGVLASGTPRNMAPDGTTMGLALSSSMGGVFVFTQTFVSFERCLEYTRLTPEVGIVGRTGAGKSSLFMAILRVLKATHGYVSIDGVNIASVPLQELRSVVTLDTAGQ
ncbi:hypothetical protein MTO96_032624, partial [Rhipicephalus appendiculatus]